MEKKIGFREKVYLLNFLLSIGVVYLHTQWYENEYEILTKIYHTIFYVAQNCVPFFFMMSGYLYFRNFTIDKIRVKLKSRVYTLLIPYLIWNLIYSIFLIGLKHVGIVQNIVVGENVWKIVLQILNAEFSPLWFIKYLMYFALVSPLTYFLFKNRIRGTISFGLICALNVWFYYSGTMTTPLNVNANSYVMFNYQYIFYAMGVYAALHLQDIVENSSKEKSMCAVIILVVLMLIYWMFLSNTDNVIISHSFRMIFICSIWFAFDALPSIKVPKWMKCTFFIYCSHTMILQSVQGVLEIIIEEILGDKVWIYIVEYFVLPILLVGFIVVVASVMKKHVGPVWHILNGGRG